MKELTVDIIVIEEQTIYGLWNKSNDRTISKDIHSLSNKYGKLTSKPKGSILPYYVLSRNYDPLTRDFEMFIGGKIDITGLAELSIPSGTYAKITIQPKLGLLWGLSIGKAKTYFYTKWLPQSNYQGLNMEYEFHTEKSIGKHPSIDLIFAIS